jgi:uncharacterized membrane protein
LDYVLLILLGLAWALGTPIVALIALARTGSLRDQNVRLAAELAQLRQQMTAGTATQPLPPSLPPPLVEQLPEPQETPAEPAREVPAPVEVTPPAAPPLPPPFVPALSPPVAAKEKTSLEQRLGARAFIWVGAITLALSAVFLVRYSIEEGYLSPEVRVILAALFGFGLIAGAERLRSRDDWVAQALAAAGVAALYGALFSAVALYGMISQAAAGGGAAVLTAFAIGVSLRHGIFVAALAFVGGFASPAIIGSDAPNVPVLFGYLLAIAIGTMAVIRHRGWWILGWGVLAGSAAWTVVWMVSETSGLLWVGLFLVAVAALFVWATSRRLAESATPFAEAAEVTCLVWTALAGSGVLLAVMVVFDSGRQDAGWLCLGLHGLGLYVLARRTPHFQYLAGLAPLLSLATLACWWFLASNGGWAANLDRFAWLSIIFGGGYAAGAFALMWNAGRPGFWAALSVAAALTHFLWCWFVLRDVTPGTPWGLISIGLAGPFLVGAERLVRWRERMPGATEALGYLAAGVSFFIAVAIALELSREWITVAYAVELAAVAAIARTLGLLAMRRLCWGLLAVVAVRFVFNPEVLQYPLGLTPLFNWILWGYGISIAALVVGAHFLRQGRDDKLVLAAESLAVLLGFMLVTLEVRSLFQPGAMDAPTSSFVVVWGGFALVALWRTRLSRDPVTLWAWRLAGGLALAVALLVEVVLANAIAERADVGALPIVNGLLVAYAVPAAMTALARQWMGDVETKTAGLAVGIAAGVLAFFYISLEVRHFFDPAFTREGYGADGIELYAYSFFWLLFGIALLALGFVRQAPAFRHAGMAVVCLVVAKVFLIDMAGLQGLLRVFSFLGLGAALMVLGYVYRRFGLDQKAKPSV